jgi:heterodisulfide reductase subunit C/nitrate reductase gamma subunit
MINQIVFITLTLIAFGALVYSFMRLYGFLKLTKPYKLAPLGKRLIETLKVAIFQTKILRNPLIGFIHALVFWGFCVILFGSLEMIIDGFSRTEHSLSFLGKIYQLFMISGDLFAYIILFSIAVFLFRRLFLHIKRFSGIEMKHKSHVDANIALSLIFLLMVTLIGMNVSGSALDPNNAGSLYPISSRVAAFISSSNVDGIHICYMSNWWAHITLIFLFMNILPYSKHFHVFMSVPNVFLSRLTPLGKLPNMDNITKEVKAMLDPTFVDTSEAPAEIARFGVKDVEDVTWKNYVDSLSCTQCGRCTSSCPANITGKKLSPRKIMIDLRARMNEKGPLMIKNGITFSDNKSLLHDYISPEELWACTTCNACAQECPVNINHPEMIVFMRRYLVMEESAAPSLLNVMFTNIENNGAPWQFSSQDRMLWAKDLTVN